MSYTDWADDLDKYTSEGANWLRGLIDRVVAGESEASTELHQVASWLDGLGKGDTPVVAPPASA